jgi:hypothetical protein
MEEGELTPEEKQLNPFSPPVTKDAEIPDEDVDYDEEDAEEIDRQID